MRYTNNDVIIELIKNIKEQSFPPQKVFGAQGNISKVLI